MSLFASIGTNTGMVVGSVAAAGAIAIAAFVVVSLNDTDPVLEPAVVIADKPNEMAAPDSAALSPAVEDATANIKSTLSEANDVAITAATAANRASSEVGNKAVASLDPSSGVQLDTTPATKPRTAIVTEGVGLGGLIEIDLVRVDAKGATVVAGKVPTGGQVEIYVDGQLVASAAPDPKGGFVALFDIAPSQDAQVMTLAVRDGAGNSTPSSDRIFIKGRKVVVRDPAIAAASDVVLPVIDVAPQVIVANDVGIKIVQPASFSPSTPDIMSNVTLDLISYDNTGEVVLAGRGKVGNHVRIYVNGRAVKTQAIAADGAWQLALPEVEAGIYTLRIDEIDGAGTVVSRVETPFQKENPIEVQKVARVSVPVVKTDTSPLDVKVPATEVTPKIDTPTKVSTGKIAKSPEINTGIKLVTIQPGATLWALAENRYGQGNLYMQIFEANRDNIRDPDLIYPGQIFTIPE